MASATSKALSELELNELHSNCIQLSNENKINPKNSWLLPLIDYIDQVMERQCGGESTNFQVASVTLDASIKIYSNRVDSVHGIAYQVLGGLSRTTDAPEDENDDTADQADGQTQPKERRVNHHATATLESNPKNLNIRKFDLEFDVDPLFRKMAATMDEGGARGLLLNQLCVQAGGRLVFDSADTVTGGAIVAAAPANIAPVVTEEELNAVVAAAQQQLVSVEVTSDEQQPIAEQVTEPVRAVAFEEAAAAESAVDTAPIEFSDNDDNMPAADYGVDHGDVDIDDADMTSALPRRVSMAGVPLDDEVTARSSRRRSVAGAPMELALDVENEYGYFAPEKLSAWAGPSHWKFRKGAAAAAGGADADAEPAAKPARKTKSKAAFKIDFSQKIDKAVVFKRSSRASKSMPANEDVLTLPKDVHFRGSSLRKLFYRPNYTTAKAFANRRTTIDAIVPTRVLAEYQNDEALDIADYDGNGAAGADDDDDDNEAAGYEEPAGGDFDGAGADDQEQDGALADSTNTQLAEGGLQLVSVPRKVEKINIGYAKVAKKVDVHHLKNGLWTQMQQLTGGSKKATTFSKLVARTPAAAAADELPDVSVAFCFICMLHLANEHSLTLTSNEAMTEVTIDPTGA